MNELLIFQSHGKHIDALVKIGGPEAEKAGEELKSIALGIFDKNEYMQGTMRAIAKDFTWSLEEERPRDI